MGAKLIVDNNRQSRGTDKPYNLQIISLRIAAKAISYIFHPVFIPVYIVLFLLYVHPGVFAGYSSWRKTTFLLQALSMYGLFPIVTVLLLKAVGFISSIYLATQKDRIIPYIACGIWYFWLWYVWKNLPGSPREIVILSMAIFLASVFGLMANIYIKISMHAIATGVMVAFVVMLALTQAVAFGLYISVAFLIAGLICTARFIVSNHSSKEIYIGLVSGFLSLVIAVLFN